MSRILDPDVARSLDAAIARMQRILDLGRWPTGLRLSVDERRTVEWNLELARRERRERDAVTR